MLRNLIGVLATVCLIPFGAAYAAIPSIAENHFTKPEMVQALIVPIERELKALSKTESEESDARKRIAIQQKIQKLEKKLLLLGELISSYPER